MPGSRVPRMPERSAQQPWRPSALIRGSVALHLAAASVVLAMGFTVFATTAYRWSQPRYATHTTAPRGTPGVLHIAFDRSVPIGEMEEMLRSAGARVVEGPGTTGIFGIAPVTAAQSGEVSPQMRALAARLRADARVRWVEPLTGTDGTEGAHGRRTREP